ncbi:hypothetical protein BVAVS116_0528 [Borreliella valaisiana VS116]|uniref:Uncharacterized protein n=1 Tax=Borreliella valaisiana VS116 TaxID=445987 RepID=D6RY07_BORVA|nr:hypothetical protein BVAVS116_0528 [Borreliella valaisiana VS116]
MNIFDKRILLLKNLSKFKAKLILLLTTQTKTIRSIKTF